MYEFEHIGVLRAAGLEDVAFRVTSERGPTWPPYDGGSWRLWNTVAEHMVEDGELVPWAAEDFTFVHPDDPFRYARYWGNSNDYLEMTSYLKYPGRPEHRCGFKYGRDDIRTLVSARTLGWPPALWPVSKMGKWLAPLLGRKWPHHERIIWPWTTSAEEMNEETGRHRFLDALGVLAFVPPTGHYLCGPLPQRARRPRDRPRSCQSVVASEQKQRDPATSCCMTTNEPRRRLNLRRGYSFLYLRYTNKKAHLW